MRWIVKGADRQTGQARSIDVEAPTREDAAVLANFRGLLVESIEAGPGDSKRTMFPNAGPPAYEGLRLAAIVCFVLAALSLALAIGSGCSIAAEALDAKPASSPPALSGDAADVFAGLARRNREQAEADARAAGLRYRAFVYVGGSIVAAVVHLGLGSGLIALRDIARNSYFLRRLANAG